MPRRQTARADVPTSAPDAASSAEHQPRRPPRIFAIPPQMPTSTAKAAAPAEPEPIPRRATVSRETIPTSQHGRVRALTSHGMSQEQVAELYGVTVEEIVRIIRRPD